MTQRRNRHRTTALRSARTSGFAPRRSAIPRRPGAAQRHADALSAVAARKRRHK